MRVGPVIVNNTPLVALWVLGRLDLLRELHDEVLIPQAVYDEFGATERAVRQAALENAPWIRLVSLANPQRAWVYIGLDLGEAEVLALAEERAARLVITDELKGRRYAQRLEADWHPGAAVVSQRERASCQPGSLSGGIAGGRSLSECGSD
jgi:predicted nucleic acid-binding protein